MELKIDKSAWVPVTLGEVAFEVSDRIDAPAESEYDRFVGLEHFVSGELKIQQWESTRSLVSAAKAFRKGDVLFARRNAYLRRASMVDFDGCCSGDAYVLRENNEVIVAGLLPFIVNSKSLWDFANSNAAGTMSKRVKWKDLANYEFLLPPKDQQAEIAELLWALDFSLDAKRSLKHCVERLLVVERSDHFHQEIDQTIQLHDIGEWRSGGTPSRSNAAFWGGQIPWASPKDMKKDVLSSTKENVTQAAVKSSKALLPAGAVFVVVRGLILKHTFPVASNSVPMMINQDMRAFIVDSEYLSEYVAEFLRFKAEVLLSQCTETTHGTKRLATDVLRDLEIPLTEEGIQQDYIARTDSLKGCLLQISDAVEADFGLIKSLSASLFNVQPESCSMS